ncbi:unnamed protein product [Rotaria sp. Silwood2]|nr:unnamed protein product [Rotaria sp. Silwood2]CAF3025338.1 unnamed protein product [Rotaria sp. Silwood2]CAF4242333.1 unnamed protein product [Rotaria sp. Silwood2]CAF4686777.1 unnamed protein product [Rotaria sp. Silwood2]
MSSFNGRPRHQLTDSYRQPNIFISERSVGSNTGSSSIFLQQQPMNQVASSNSSLIESCQHSNMKKEEEDLMETIERLIHIFLSRPGRRQPHKSFFRWTVNCGAIPSYHIMLTIDQDSPSLS